MIAILDYGSGNLRSAERAFATAGKDVVVTSDRTIALEAEGLELEMEVLVLDHKSF